MTSEEKAKYLINYYLQIHDGRVPQAVQCSLFAVDEIIYELELTNNYEDIDRLQYWKEVKQEILKHNK